MMKNIKLEAIQIASNVTITIRDSKTRNILRRIKKHNLITDVTLNTLVAILNGGDGDINCGWLGVGTDDTLPDPGDLILINEVYRVSTSKQVSTGKITITAILGTSVANGNTLREAGLFNANSNGILISRVIHDDIIKTNTRFVDYNWEINVNAS